MNALPSFVRLATNNGPRGLYELTSEDILFNEKGAPVHIDSIEQVGVQDTYSIIFNDGRSITCANGQNWELNLVGDDVKRHMAVEDIMALYLNDRVENKFVSLSLARNGVVQFPGSLFTKARSANATGNVIAGAILSRTFDTSVSELISSSVYGDPLYRIDLLSTVLGALNAKSYQINGNQDVILVKEDMSKDVANAMFHLILSLSLPAILMEDHRVNRWSIAITTPSGINQLLGLTVHSTTHALQLLGKADGNHKSFRIRLNSVRFNALPEYCYSITLKDDERFFLTEGFIPVLSEPRKSL